MRCWTILTVGLLGCQQVPSSGNLFKPATVAQAQLAVQPTGPQGSFDFEEEDFQEGELADPEADDAPVSGDDALALQAKMLGIPVPSRPAATPTAPSTPAPAVAPSGAQAVPMPQWDGAAKAPVLGSFGLKVVSTHTEVQPPYANVILGDGTGLMVRPGDMIPEAKLIILAVGRDAVQVATVTPEGFYARVDTETLSVFYPVQPAE